MKRPATALILLKHAVGRDDTSGKFLVKAGPRVLQDECALPEDWPQTAPGQALTEYFTCLSTNCHDADPTVFDGSGDVHCSDVVASGMAPCGSSIPGIPFAVSDLCPEECNRACSSQLPDAAVITTGPPSEAVADWLHDEAEEALDDQVTDDETQLGHWKLTMNMNTDQSERRWFHLNGGRVVDLGVPFLDEPLLAVRLTGNEADPNKTVLIGNDMGCRNWKDIFAYPRVENSNFEKCKNACLGLDDCTDFSVNAEQGICETWKGTCIGWKDEGWSYYTFANKPFRPNFKSVAGSDEITVSFWLNWHAMRAGPTLVNEFFQFTKINLDGGYISATTRGGDTFATDSATCGSIGPDSFHQLVFAFSKSQSRITVYVDGALCQTSHITWVDEPRGRDFGLPSFGSLTGVVTGFKGFAGETTQADVTTMYEGMSSLYSTSTYKMGATAAPVVTAPPATSAPVTTEAPVVTAQPATAPPVVTTAPPATAAPLATTAAPVVTAPPLEAAPTYSPGHVTPTEMCTTAVAGTVQWCLGPSNPDEEQSCDEICSSHGGCMEDCWFDAISQFATLAQSVGLTCSTTQMGGAPFDPSVEGTGIVNCGVSAKTDPSDCGECEGHVVQQQAAGGRCGLRPYKQEPEIRRFCPCGAAGDACGYAQAV